MKIVCIYGLVCPVKNKIVYVGRTQDLKLRLTTHRQNKPTVKCLLNWMNELDKNSQRKNIKAVILEKLGPGTFIASRRETEWINLLSKNHALLNIRQVRKEEDRIISVPDYEKISGLKIKAI